jgi:hypothetical protein
MKVAPAVQLLSHHSAILAQKVFPGNPEISQFFDVMNNGFDTFNSRGRPNEKNLYLQPFGLKLEKQLESLAKMKEMMLRVRFATKKKKEPKKALLPCQKGIIVSINSLTTLFNYLQSNYGLKFILTSAQHGRPRKLLFNSSFIYVCMYVFEREFQIY